MTDDNRECEVPLIEQLRDIPKDYRTVRAIQWDEDGRETGHQFIPVGLMMHRAAAELESQAAEIENLETAQRLLTDMLASDAAEIELLKEDAERYRWLRQSDCRDGVPFIAIFDGRLSQWTGTTADEQVDSAKGKS